MHRLYDGLFDASIQLGDRGGGAVNPATTAFSNFDAQAAAVFRQHVAAETARVMNAQQPQQENNNMTIDEHLRSMPSPPPWTEQNELQFRPNQEANNMLGMGPSKAILQHQHNSVGPCHSQQHISVPRCDARVPSSSDSSSSSCSPSSTENLLQSSLKADSSLDASVAAILNLNQALKPEPLDLDNEYLQAMHRNSLQNMPLHLNYSNRCSSSSDSVPSTPSTVRRSRSSQEGMLKCQFCPKKWSDPPSLELHMQDCRLVRVHECSQCGKRFKARGGLQQHMRIHNNDRPYACHFCSKRFTQKSHVDQHERIHTGAKPFSCQYCGRAFRQRSQQLGHEATHGNGGSGSAESRSNEVRRANGDELHHVDLNIQNSLQLSETPATNSELQDMQHHIQQQLQQSQQQLQQSQQQSPITQQSLNGTNNAVNSLLALSQTQNGHSQSLSLGQVPLQNSLGLGHPHLSVMDQFPPHSVHQALLNHMI